MIEEEDKQEIQQMIQKQIGLLEQKRENRIDCLFPILFVFVLVYAFIIFGIYLLDKYLTGIFGLTIMFAIVIGGAIIIVFAMLKIGKECEKCNEKLGKRSHEEKRIS